MTTSKKQINFRQVAKKVLSVVLPIFSALFLIGTTGIILVIVSGYSIDVNKQQLLKTGVLDVETNPAEANITLDGIDYGTSNKAIPSLLTGEYAVSISKQGYYPYIRHITVKHGLATLINTPLIKATGADVVGKTETTDLIWADTAGFFILRPQVTATSGTTGTVAPEQDDKKSTYTLIRQSVVRDFFSPPRALAENLMTITLPKEYAISTFSVSPNGNSLLVIIQKDKTILLGTIIPIKKGATVDATKQANTFLNYYVSRTGNTVSWAQNSDYVLVDTPTQLISFNNKTTARVILADKPEAKNADAVIWSMTDEGVLLVRKSATQQTTTAKDKVFVSALLVSYNGNVVDLNIPDFEVDALPSKAWAMNKSGNWMVVLTTPKGAYLVGKLFSPKTGEYEVSTESTVITDIPVSQLSPEVSLIKFVNATVNNVDFVLNRHMITYTDAAEKSFSAFLFNKRSADHATTIGMHTLVKDSSLQLGHIMWIYDASYALLTAGNNLAVVDYRGENYYVTQYGVNQFASFLSDIAILYKGDDNNLYFKLLR